MTDSGSLAAAPLLGLPLPELWFGLLFALLGAYLLLDGFDFGVGILFATRSDEADRERLLASIGPFWDGNEVWLVVFGGSLFAAFPSAYANLLSRHYLLGFAILLALGLRGLAPELYEQREDDRWRRLWGLSFVVGSVASPFLLGLFVGGWALGAAGVTPAGVAVGVTVVALTVVEGAAFLGLKTRGPLREEMGRYGERAALAYFGLLAVSLAYLFATRPDLRPALTSTPAFAGVALTVAGVGGFIAATRTERYVPAFACAMALAFALVGVVATLLYPAIDPASGLSVAEAAVSTLPLNLVTIAAAVLLPLVLTYFAVLYSVFRGPANADEVY